MTIEGNNPFVGARSYEEKDQYIFFGREQESIELFQLVNINSFTLLYGKSGLGKTSILQAGLFPKLREAKFTPIYVRPNYRDVKSDFIKETENIIKKNLEESKYIGENIKSKETLWEYFHRQTIKDEKGNTITIVLVFDQFEEIFTLGTKEKSSELRPNTKQFIEFLSDLIENSPPKLLDEEKRLELQFEYGSKKPPVKIIFSFRQEYLGDFYELSKFIPSIAYSNLQYKLNPLNFDKGFSIIEQASKGLFQADAINQTLIIVSESNSLEEAKKRDIDSFLLSIFCENQFEILKGKDNSFISAEEISKVNVQNLVYNKYHEIIKELNLNQDEIRLLEDRLLSPEGFRWPVYLDIVYYNPRIRKEIIEALQEKKILKQYFIDGRKVIEIIHDKYALAIKTERDFRLNAEQKQLQLDKNREEAEKKLAQQRAKLTRYALVILAIAIMVAYFIAHNLTNLANSANSSLAIVNIDTISNEKAALKILANAHENFDSDDKQDSVVARGIRTSKSKMLVLFNKGKLSSVNISEKLSMPTSYNLFNKSSKILVAYQSFSNTPSSGSTYSVLYDKKGNYIKKIQDKLVLPIENSNSIAVIDSPFIEIYKDCNFKQPVIKISDGQFFNNKTKITSVHYFFSKDLKFVLLTYSSANTTKFIIYFTKDNKPIDISPRFNDTKPSENLNAYNDQFKQAILLKNGNIILIKRTTDFLYNSYYYFSTYKPDMVHGTNNTPFQQVQDIIISPDQSCFLTKNNDKWTLNKDNLVVDLKNTSDYTQAKFDIDDNITIAGRSSVCFYDKNGAFVGIEKIKFDKLNLKILDFRKPYLLLCEQENQSKNIDQVYYNLRVYNYLTNKDRLDIKIKNLIDCRLSYNTDSLFIYQAISRKESHFSYNVYDINKNKFMARLGLYYNRGIDYIFLNNCYSGDVSTAFSSSKIGDAPSYFGAFLSFGDQINVFPGTNGSSNTVSSGSNSTLNSPLLTRLKLYDIQHPGIAFTDSLKLIIPWINDSIKVSKSEQLYINQYLRHRDPWTFTKNY